MVHLKMKIVMMMDTLTKKWNIMGGMKVIVILFLVNVNLSLWTEWSLNQ